jgi:signal transduction histidine kinase
MITADAIKLKQIVYNLVSNAVKFSPDGSVVHVIVRRSPEGVTIAVADQGIGIAREHQEIIFDEFRQVHAPRSKRPSGTGLGLTLVKKFVEMHGGTVRVESELGKGSVFTVLLPQA